MKTCKSTEKIVKKVRKVIEEKNDKNEGRNRSKLEVILIKTEKKYCCTRNELIESIGQALDCSDKVLGWNILVASLVALEDVYIYTICKSFFVSYIISNLSLSFLFTFFLYFSVLFLYPSYVFNYLKTPFYEYDSNTFSNKSTRS